MTDFTLRRAIADLRTMVKIAQAHVDVLTDAEKAEAAAVRSFWRRFLEEEKVRQVRDEVNDALLEKPLPTDTQTVIDRLT